MAQNFSLLKDGPHLMADVTLQRNSLKEESGAGERLGDKNTNGNAPLRQNRNTNLSQTANKPSHTLIVGVNIMKRVSVTDSFIIPGSC